MRQFIADITVNNEVLLSDIRINLSQQIATASAMGSWHGNFRLSRGLGQVAFRLINDDGPFFIHLNDGRSGNIHVTGVDEENTGIFVVFTGSGSLNND